MNIAVALGTVVALIVLFTNEQAREEVTLGVAPAIGSGLIALSVIVSSLMALLGRPRARWIALGAAVLYFGLLLLQSLRYIIDPSDILPDGSSPHLWANVIRNSIEIALNIWVFTSAKVAAFFKVATLPT